MPEREQCWIRDRASSRYRASLAVAYRMQGMGYDTIAKELGYANRSGAWKAVDRCLRQRELRVADDFFALTMADLEMIHARAWRGAMAGERRATRICMRTVELRIKLIERYSGNGGAAA